MHQKLCLLLGVILLSACGGSSRYAVLEDVDDGLASRFEENERFNAFFCTEKEPCIPDREAFRVPWTVVCGADEPCGGGLKKYQDLFDGAAKVLAIVKQIRFIVQGLIASEYAQADVEPIISFAMRTIPGIVGETKGLINTISSLDPVSDLESEPMLAPKVASALPSVASSLASVVDEVGQIISAFSEMGIEMSSSSPVESEATKTDDPTAEVKESSGGDDDNAPADEEEEDQDQEGELVIVVVRQRSIPASVVQGLGLKIGMRIEEELETSAILPESIEASLPKDDDEFYFECVADDQCAYRFAEMIDYDSVLFVVVSRRGSRFQAKYVLVSNTSTQSTRRQVGSDHKSRDFDDEVVEEVAELLEEYWD